ncbi:hypothetical protein D9611_010453 [Ephemerocybe angulata]|uniref:Uncharacterized protein n=1 Tax=Ephemerocybe angulata TaxID=980116 RepID=A0A8H5BUV4_9AGAR|nr:hypothetical protein D9611_010453 [Tulosesus angulatus]
MDQVGARSFQKRGTPMAVMIVTACTVGLGAMYYMGKDVKSKEGLSSPYRIDNPGQGAGGTDKAMSSSQVSEVASGAPIPGSGKERVPGAVKGEAQ